MMLSSHLSRNPGGHPRLIPLLPPRPVRIKSHPFYFKRLMKLSSVFHRDCLGYGFRSHLLLGLPQFSSEWWKQPSLWGDSRQKHCLPNASRFFSNSPPPLPWCMSLQSSDPANRSHLALHWLSRALSLYPPHLPYELYCPAITHCL